jgi:hypothetical protein
MVLWEGVLLGRELKVYPPKSYDPLRRKFPTPLAINGQKFRISFFAPLPAFF